MSEEAIRSVRRQNDVWKGSLAASACTAALYLWRSVTSFLVEIAHMMSFINKAFLHFALMKAAMLSLCVRHATPTSMTRTILDLCSFQ